MKKLAISGYKQIDEISRRRIWGNKSFVMAMCSITIFVCLLLLGVLLSEGRECKVGFALENAVCVACEDANCLECKTTDMCSTCSPGYLLNKLGQCVSCNPDDDKSCLECEFEKSEISTNCVNCDKGYRLEFGQCVKCS